MRSFWKIAVPLALTALASLPANAAGPSFSCRGNLNRAERIICGSAELSRLDRQVSRLYRSAGGPDQATSDVVTYVRGALVSRNRCRSDDCIRDVMQDEIEFLQGHQEDGGY
jgi:uncharacterized protein